MSTLSNLTAAIERALAAVRTIHPDVRPAIVVVFRHDRGDRRGHYQPESWTSSNTDIDEIHVSSTILAEGAASVLRTLLHEAAHSVARTRNVQDQSRQARWHNQNFASLADELGLVTERSPHVGIATPDLKPATRATFANVLADLQQSLDLHQEPASSSRPRVGSRMLKLTCPACRRVIRATHRTMNVGPIRCVPCAADFVQAQARPT